MATPVGPYAILLLIASALALANPSLSALSSKTDGAITYEIDGIQYFSPSYEVSELKINHSLVTSSGEPNLLPLTVFSTNTTEITQDILSSMVEKYGAVDDVWSPGFMKAAIVVAPEGSSIASEALSWLGTKGVEYLVPGFEIKSDGLLCSGPLILPPQRFSGPAGPYIMRHHGDSASLHQVYRLYHDETMSFTQGIVPIPDSTMFSGVEIYDPRHTGILIPVPSRLYSLSDPRPLAGLRFAVKDLYDIEGLQTTGGSRVYSMVTPTANVSAISVTKLLELGAVPIGKTKTSQFAYGIEPWFWQDFKYPWNPRGDGWLQIAYSSSGSGAAIVAYDWIDFALGSDTGGSVRMPASLGGSYGIRPIWGGMNLTGVLPLSNPFDSAGFFARDPKLFSKIGKLWYADSEVEVDRPYKSFPTKLIYPVDYFPLASDGAQKVVDDFVRRLEEEIGMVKKEIDLTKTLSLSKNPAISNKTITEGLFMPTFTYDSWRQIGNDLVDRWNSAFPDAGFPPFDNGTRASYMSQAEVTQEIYDDILADKAAFKAFAEEHILGASDDTCSNGIMLMHSGGEGLPVYREEYLNEQPGAGFLVIHDPPLLNPCMISPLMGTPTVDIPIGQTTYQSVISLQTEYLPVVIDLMAAPGCDYMLYDLVETLQKRGLIQTVKTGKLAF